MLRIGYRLLFVIVVGSSCTTTQDKGEPIEKEDISLFEHGVIATVTTEFQDEGCEVLLELNNHSDRALLMPIELDEKYKVDGLELLITYSNSRIMQSDCQMGRPVVLNSVKLVD